MKRIKLSFLLLLAGTGLSLAQPGNGIVSMDEFREQLKRKNIEVPGFDGYQALKCDFHMHTVFSDGNVWPTIRVREAWQEGLDAIAITDHIEYQPHSEDVKVNLNESTAIASKAALECNLVLVKASEITRQTPPGHFNALFISDASGFLGEKAIPANDRKAIDKPASQNAFIFWNHPGWKAESVRGSYEWIGFVDTLYKDKIIKGIEVFNGTQFYQKALDWGLDRHLTILGNSDEHGVYEHGYRFDNIGHRTMTLVFAGERTEAGIREALEAGRTVAWSSKYLAGREDILKKLFNACVQTGNAYFTRGDRRFYEIRNISDLYFELRLKAGNGNKSVILFPHSTQIINAAADQESLEYEAVTTFVGGNRNLMVEIPLRN